MLINAAHALTAYVQERRDRGAVAGEYAVLLALIGIALVTVIGLFTGGVVRAFDGAIAILP